MGRKVAIVAKGGTSALAPWHDEEWEIWGMPWISYPRVDILFEVHEKEVYKDENFIEMYKSKAPSHYWDLPIYVPKSRLEEFPNAIELPVKHIQKACNQTFLENTICYQIGLAILDGVDEIALYGVHMRGASEYDHEKSFVMYALGVAEGKGIKVTVADGCPLFMSRFEQGRYGVNDKIRDTSNLFGNPTIQFVNPKKD